MHNAWVAVLAYHFGMIVVILLTKEKFTFRLILKNTNYKLLIVLATMGAASGLVLFALWPFLGIPADITMYLRDIGLTATSWPFFLAYFILVNPWLEECYWRGYLGSDSRRLTLNDIWFSGYHILVLAGNIAVVWLITVFAVLSLAAWFWRQADRWNKGLAASVISHLTADISVMLTIYFVTGM